MTHFGIICPAANGHLNLMCVGIKLQRRGHRLTLFHPDIESKVKTAGLEFQAIGSAFFHLENSHNINNWEKTAKSYRLLTIPNLSQYSICKRSLLVAVVCVSRRRSNTSSTF